MADEVIITNVGADVSVTSVGAPIVEISTTEQAQLVVETIQIQGPPGVGEPGPQGQEGPSGQAGTYVSVKNMGASELYTPIIADAGSLVTFAGNATITLPTNAAAGIAIGKVIDFVSFGGVLTFVESGTTIYRPDTLVTRKAASTVSAIKVATNAWLLAGDLV